MPRVGVRTLLILASVVSLLGFLMVTPWETPSYLLYQGLQLALVAATIAAVVGTGERRAFYAGAAILGWLHLGALLFEENGFLISALLILVYDRFFSLQRNPGPGSLFVVTSIAAIAYGGGCFGRWLYRREHGREPVTAGRQQESPSPGGEG